MPTLLWLPPLPRTSLHCKPTTTLEFAMNRSLPLTEGDGGMAICKLAEERLGMAIKRLNRTAESLEAEQLVNAEMKNISDEISCEYKEALRKVPSLVSTESTPLNFFKVCNDFASASARRIADYWIRRKALFESSAYKPLTATGSGAMTKQDIEVFDSGFFVVLPTNRNSSPVVCYDRSRLEEDFDDLDCLLESMIRCVFYVFSIVAEEEEAQAHGVVLLEINHSTFKPLPIDEPFRRSLLNIVAALPITLAHSHIVFKFPRTESESFISSFYDEAVKTIEDTTPKDSYTILCGNMKKQLGCTLEERGFRRDDLPVTVGGTWKYFEHFTRWKRERRVVEQLIETAQLGPEKRIEAALDIINVADAKSKKRAKDVIYARNKRMKGRTEAKTLREQILALQNQRKSLQQTHDRLVYLMGQAQIVISEAMSSGPQSLSYHAMNRNASNPLTRWPERNYPVRQGQASIDMTALGLSHGASLSSANIAHASHPLLAPSRNADLLNQHMRYAGIMNSPQIGSSYELDLFLRRQGVNAPALTAPSVGAPLRTPINWMGHVPQQHPAVEMQDGIAGSIREGYVSHLVNAQRSVAMPNSDQMSSASLLASALRNRHLDLVGTGTRSHNVLPPSLHPPPVFGHGLGIPGRQLPAEAQLSDQVDSRLNNLLNIRAAMAASQMASLSTRNVATPRSFPTQYDSQDEESSKSDNN